MADHQDDLSAFMAKPVWLEPPLPDRLDRFEWERIGLDHIFDGRNNPVEIEHIGSTAVEGLPAKPVIDIAVRMNDLCRIEEYIPLLRDAGYRHLGEYGLPGRQFFVKSIPYLVHLHVVDGGTPYWDLWIKFRDILRENEDVKQRYLELKEDLAQRYGDERTKYTAGKSDFINGVLELLK